jgi:hypothetical protein
VARGGLLFHTAFYKAAVAYAGRLTGKVTPGAEHNAGRGGEFGPYGERKRFDFFVRHLLGVTPPSWNDPPPASAPPTGRQSAGPMATNPPQ